MSTTTNLFEVQINVIVLAAKHKHPESVHPDLEHSFVSILLKGLVSCQRDLQRGSVNNLRGESVEKCSDCAIQERD